MKSRSVRGGFLLKKIGPADGFPECSVSGVSLVWKKVFRAGCHTRGQIWPRLLKLRRDRFRRERFHEVVVLGTQSIHKLAYGEDVFHAAYVGAAEHEALV